MLDAVRLLHSLGVSYVDLATMASSNPAKLLGVDKDCGSIEAGKRADLVALDHDDNVKLTLVGGRSVPNPH
jgi:N-acetylglucosamine-6-phosphate deacetylase